MPFKSEAQRRKFYELAKEGKIKKETLEEYEKESEGKDLPERVPPKSVAEARKQYKRKLQKK